MSKLLSIISPCFNKGILILLCICSILSASSHGAESGFDWNKWAAALNDDPCNWLSEAELFEIYGKKLTKKTTNTREGSSCSWRDAAGLPILTLSVNTWKSAKEVNHERDGQESQANRKEKTPFKKLASNFNVTSNYLRTDRLMVYIFANDDKELAFVTINGHRTLNEKPELKKQRKENLQAATKIFLEKYKF